MRASTLIAIVGLATLANTGQAQLPRTQGPAAAGIAPSGGIPRDPRHPYAGVWVGVRTMDMGSDDISFRFTVADGQYSGATLHPSGGRSPQNNLAVTTDGLTWDQPNSGGGTWVFKVHLASPDSMVGTLFLRDAPANLQPAPQGTMVLKRQAPVQTRQP